jgi:hypothetical protein
VVKALTQARLNTYALNPTTVSVSVPPISGEQRVEIARHVKKLGETPRSPFGRSVRRHANRSRHRDGARNGRCRMRPMKQSPRPTDSSRKRSRKWEREEADLDFDPAWNPVRSSVTQGDWAAGK